VGEKKAFEKKPRGVSFPCSSDTTGKGEGEQAQKGIGEEKKGGARTRRGFD